MAQTKTDYGLIYNDDGSVCTTVRPDQTPFPGVNSFAVETATTNLIQNPIFETTENWRQFPNSYNIWTDEKALFGSHCFKRSRLDTSDTSNDYAYQYIYNPPSGVVYTLSAYVNITKHIQGNFSISGAIHYTDSTKIYLSGITYSSITNGWVRKSATFTTDPNKTINFIAIWIHGMRSVGNFFGEAYVDGIQLEVKPFASSFTVGSRPKGRLVIPVEDLKFDIANDDWVISYWKYPIATRDDTQNHENICSLGQWTSDNSKGYIKWGKRAGTNKYRLQIFLNDATSITNISVNTFNPTDYFYHWHYEVMKKQGKTFSYYVDGVKQVEHTIPADKELQTPFDVGLGLGGDSDNPTNTLIANVGNGKLKSGEFTDEHIMAIYEANRAFAQKGGVKIY